MKRFTLLVLIFSIVFLAGCAGGPRVIPGEEAGSFRHYYQLIIIDGNSEPLKDASVEYRFYDDHLLVRTGVSVTDSEGVVTEGVNVRRNRSGLDFRVTKPGFYEATGMLRSDYGDIRYERPLNGQKVQLLKDVDYIHPSFSGGAQLQQTMITFIHSFIARGDQAESTLVPWSVGLARHQNRHYFRFAVDDKTMYNSEAFFENKLVERIFRDTASPALVFADSHTADATMIFGYDLTVRALCRNFCEPDDKGRIREFRFLVPQTAARRYAEGILSREELQEQVTFIVDGRIVDI